MSSNNKLTYNELIALRQRFKVFLDKLSVRANELLEDTRNSAQEIYNEDDNKFHLFKYGIEGQFKSIIQKAEDVFKQQIENPYNSSNRSNDDSDIEDCYDEIFSEYHEWRDSINNMSYKAFDNVEEKDPEEELKHILDEYEKTISDFHCSQCGSQLPINQIYFLATYISCPHCSTQNTFVPSTKMSMLEHISRDIAEARCKPLKKIYKKYVKKDGWDLDIGLSLYLNYRRGVLMEYNKIVPSLSKENEEIYFREMNDIFNEYGIEFNERKDLYHNIIMRMDSLCYTQNQSALNNSFDNNDLIETEEILNRWLWELEFNTRNLKRISLPNCEFVEEMEKINNNIISTTIEPFFKVIQLKKEGKLVEAEQISNLAYKAIENNINNINAASDRFCSINNI